MTYAAPASTYQEVAVRSASPGQLVVMVYDHLLLNLRRARMGMERQDVELRLVAFDRARQALGELLSTLDHERGGEVAGQLNALYTFMFGELTELGTRADIARLDRVIAMVTELRDTFAEVSGRHAQVPAAELEVA